MSKIHQAIRRAEKEGRVDLTHESGLRKNILAEIKKEIMRPPLSANPVRQELEQEADGQPTLGGAISNVAELKFPPDSKLVAISAPRSFPCEQYRALKNKLWELREGKNLRTILITSAAASEGKTLTAVNLALTIAQEIEQTVLLVDADLRNPTVHRLLGFPAEKGLAELLKGDLQSSQVILKTKMHNFYVMPAGSIPENPTELLNTQKMRDFLGKAGKQYDWVILDSPPFIPVADAQLMSCFVDGILLVVRALYTPADLLSKSVQPLQGKNVLGIVFNGIQNSRTRGNN
jgi:protein-tyrosine kinase